MTQPAPTAATFRDYAGSIFSDAGFHARNWPLVSEMEPVLLVENPYYIIAFQFFDHWNDLVLGAGEIEIALSDLIGRTPYSYKTWDAYLLLVCRSELFELEELNQFSELTYNTQRTRKVVRVGIGDTLTRLQEVVRPFVALERVQSSAKGRDPLNMLGQRMIQHGVNENDISRLITLFKERGTLGDD